MSRLSNVPQYLNLSLRGGAPARLCMLKNAAAYTNAPDVNLPPSRRFADWRAAREATLTDTGPALSAGYNTENAGTPYEKRTPVYVAFCGDHFRDERHADDIDGAGIDHRGWFADADCSNTVRGLVGRLSHGRFVAGYSVKDNGEHVYLCEVFDDEREAARTADRAAELYADAEREYSERWQAAQELAERITARKSRVSELFALRNHPRHRDTARDELAEVCAIIRKMRAELADDYADIEF
jgi:hypothetical protein